MRRLAYALAIVLGISGCGLDHHTAELLTPDSVQVGASIKADQPQRIDAYTFQLRWDLK